MLNAELNQIIKKIELESQTTKENSLERSLLLIARQALAEYSHLLNDEAVTSIPVQAHTLLFNHE